MRSTPRLPVPPQPRSESAAGVEEPAPESLGESPPRGFEQPEGAEGARALRGRAVGVWGRRRRGLFPRRGGGGGDAAALLSLPRLPQQLQQPTPEAARRRRGGGSRRPRRLPAARPDAASPQPSPRAAVVGPGLRTSR